MRLSKSRGSALGRGEVPRIGERDRSGRRLGLSA